MALSLILYGVIVVLAVVYFSGYWSRPKNFPPGPLGLPLIGNAAQVGLFMHKKAVELEKKYGDIIAFRLGGKWVLCLNNPDDIRDAFSRPEFASKTGFNPPFDETVEDFNKGLIMSYGRPWVEHRRFTLRTLRDFGLGKRSMEGIIMEEVRQLIEEFKSKHCDHPFRTDHIFNMAVFNVIWSIVAGKRHGYGDPQLQRLMDLMAEFWKSSFTGVRILMMLFPVLLELRKIKHKIFGRRPKKFLEEICGYFRDAIQEHERTIEPGNPRDFIDTYLEEVKKTTDPASSFYREDPRDDSSIIFTLLDLFIAGSESTSTTLQWVFFALALNPEAQEKVYQEIASVAGHREISLTDRPKLPYTEATIMEVLRISELAPTGVPHATDRETTLKGFTIPKNTVVFANFYAVHRNPKIWDEPVAFIPERFLSADGESVVRHKTWLPFSVGKRACLGESLARDELFLFTTNLVQNLKISMPVDEPPHTWEGVFRVGFAPEAHWIIVKCRQ